MHLFLSPHYDDAVLSCGGTIHNLIRKGEAVTVLTVMGGNPFPDRIPDTPHVRILHARWQVGSDPVAVRVEEDRAAVSSLGAKVQVADVLDAVYRLSANGEALYPYQESIFGEVHPDDPASRLSDMNIADLHDVEIIYAPLGAGHHVDHQLVRDWGLALKKDNPSLALKFYEEYPYTEINQAVEQALTALPATTFVLEPYLLEAADTAAKVAAIACYQSQISTFWDNVSAMERATRQSLERAGNGRPAERFWHYLD